MTYQEAQLGLDEARHSIEHLQAQLGAPVLPLCCAIALCRVHRFTLAHQCARINWLSPCAL